MARNSDGGTKKWCAHCNGIRVCAAVNPSQLGKTSGQRWAMVAHNDINWFRRGIICLTCYGTWLTAEVDEQFLEELVQLRNALGEIKVNAEHYIAQSNDASESLARLSASIGSLRALRAYNSQK